MTRIVVNPGYRVRDSANSRDALEGEIIDVPDKEGRVLLALRRASLAPPRRRRRSRSRHPRQRPRQPRLNLWSL